MNQDHLIALLIWKMRHHLDGPVIRITPEDREAFQKSLAYNEQTAVVNVEDRSGTTVIHLTDGTGDQLIFTESDERDLDRANAKRQREVLKQQIPELVRSVRTGLASGNYSEADMADLCNAAELLAKA